jgi:hypothetical protein
MKIVDFHGTVVARTDGELEEFLSRRHGEGINAFWLFQEREEYPKLSILVKGDVAHLHYFATEHEVGFRSAGNICGLEQNGTTVFSLSQNPADDVYVLNDSVVPFSVAISVAKEFFDCTGLPRGITWLEL